MVGISTAFKMLGNFLGKADGVMTYKIYDVQLYIRNKKVYDVIFFQDTWQFSSSGGSPAVKIIGQCIIYFNFLYCNNIYRLLLFI